MKSELGAGHYVLPARPDFCWRGYLENHYSQITIFLMTLVIPIYIPLRWASNLNFSDFLPLTSYPLLLFPNPQSPIYRLKQEV